MNLDSSTPTAQYSNRDYWEKRYAKEEEKEWLCGYETVSHIIRRIAKPSDRIMIIGCGNSPFSADLFNDGYSNLTNIDYASSVIENMRNRYPRMKWIQMDMRKMEFDSHSYNVVIEKATLDALLAEERDPWNISEEGARQIDRVLTEISRVLTDDGVFASISFAQPHFRLPLYARADYNWSPDVKTVGDYFHYYAYIMTKGRPINSALVDKYSYARKQNEPQQCLSKDHDDEDFWRRVSLSE